VVADPDGDVGRTGVFAGVGERFLNDPVGGQIDSGGQVSSDALHLDLHWQAGGPGVGDEFVEPSETGDGMMRWWFIDTTQDAEGSAHLAEQIAAGFFNRGECAVRSYSSSRPAWPSHDLATPTVDE
jgi:hypothetical protein